MKSNDEMDKVVSSADDIAPKRGGLALAFKIAVLGLCAALVPLGVTLAIPEKDDGAYSTRIKHKQLARSEPGKIILVGGSNLSFGIDSGRITERTGCIVANMGLNGYFGINYQLGEVLPHLRAGDKVVLILEYDAYLNPANGDPTTLIGVLKANPAAIRYMNVSQMGQVASRVPLVAQEKLSRLIKEGAASVFGGAEDDPYDIIYRFVSYRGYDSHGDVVAHLGTEWPLDLKQGLPMDRMPMRSEVVDAIEAFSREAQEKNVALAVSFTPVERKYYTKYQPYIYAIYRELEQKRKLPVVSTPGDYVFDKSMMFDTVYHLDAQGRRIRTEKLIGDLERGLGDGLGCRSASAINKGKISS